MPASSFGQFAHRFDKVNGHWVERASGDGQTLISSCHFRRLAVCSGAAELRLKCSLTWLIQINET